LPLIQAQNFVGEVVLAGSVKHAGAIDDSDSLGRAC